MKARITGIFIAMGVFVVLTGGGAVYVVTSEKRECLRDNETRAPINRNVAVLDAWLASSVKFRREQGDEPAAREAEKLSKMLRRVAPEDC